MEARAIRFYLDENMPVALAVQLKQRGIEAVTVLELHLLGDKDINHLVQATEMGYVFCTHDADYIQLAAAGTNHAGIVFGQMERLGIGDWVKWLELIHAVYTADEMLNRVEYF